MPKTQSTNANIRAAERFAEMRARDIPMQIHAHYAWHLSGGIVGKPNDFDNTVNLSTIAEKAPDCLSFIPDYNEAVRYEAFGDEVLGLDDCILWDIPFAECAGPRVMRTTQHIGNESQSVVFCEKHMNAENGL